MRVAILDDYQGVALETADWSQVARRAGLVVFNDHLADPEAVVGRRGTVDARWVMRGRPPQPRPVLERLPRLKLIASTGPRNASIDIKAAAELGVEIAHTGYDSSPTVELSWALIMATVRQLPAEAASLRAGGWQRRLGAGLRGKTLGVLGLGNIGGELARIAQAFGMEAIAWSQNLTPEKAAGAGARYVPKAALFAEADVVSVNLVLSERTRGLVDAEAIRRMKPTAYLVNTSRGPIVEEAALIAALQEGRIAGAGLDVLDVEPLPADHPIRTLDRHVATPHIGYVTRELYRTFYGDAAKAIAGWLERQPG